MIVVGVVLSLLAIALLVIGGMAFARKLPGNSYIGIRVAEVRKSPEVWEAAHHVAGTFWLFGGVALTFGALISFIAEGWLWLIPVGAVIVAVVAVGAGANVGARTAAALDVEKEYQEQQKAQEPAPAPEVDMSALRRAVDKSRHPED
ncbi:hypothetical protein C3B44_11415 [Corynebacterium yudongzhengii]|uniref:SdpI family protein n=1 Tax=Corynebacterium yudongzhengii TaxID=2080740 RepID=A0A2U1T4E4_9CORY|nr:SdpI family protein [Corynebacterium yudongzhengii]AWB82859.1 hypothetical protein C3B44_11415 [Corynebacterium yudongzhengii]PWC00852.1 hypothetical protein DF222_10600 [Corynebacterium yudongzhengii]